MPSCDLLPDAIVTTLRTSEMAALAAALIIAAKYPAVLAFASRSIAGEEQPERSAPRATAPNHRGRPNAADRSSKIIALMRSHPGITIGEMAKTLRCSRSTIALRLNGLRDEGSVEHVDRGAWRVVEIEPETPPAPVAEKWVEPLSAKHRARARIEAEAA